jgi:hypothetical protein
MQAKKTLDKNSLIERDARIKARLDELREFAADEGESLNEASIEDFLSLMRENESFRAPYIFSTEIGNISIMWKTEGVRLSIVFEGRKRVEYTYFKGITKEFIPLPVVCNGNLYGVSTFINTFLQSEIMQDFFKIGNANDTVLKIANNIDNVFNQEISQKSGYKHRFSERLA